MSVIIKGMEVPKCCRICDFNAFSMYCRRTGSEINRDYEHRERLSDCPISELPDKHGRLIDADALEPDADYDDGEFWAYSVTQVCDEPTVIEAEGVEE